MTKKLSTAEKASHITGKYSTRNVIITGIFLLGATTAGILLSNSKKGNSNQEVKKQKVDSGSINNYNAGRDIKIENSTQTQYYNSVSGNGNTIVNGDKVGKSEER